MKNPTEYELNTKFALNVAGWNCEKEGVECLSWYNENGAFMGGRNDGQPWSGIPKYCTSADLVLPWLEKRYMETDWIGGPIRHYTTASGKQACWRVRLPGSCAEAEAETLPRAIVIALLRAHGIEVEFT